MSSHHRTQVRNRLPDVDGIRNQVNSLRGDNRRLAGELDASRRSYSALHASVGGLHNEIAASHRDNQRLGRSLEQTQSAVSGLAAEHQALAARQGRIENGLANANRHIGQLRQSQQILQNEMHEVRSVQHRQQRHLQSLDRSVNALEAGQQALRDDLELQRRETQSQLRHLDAKIESVDESQQELRRDFEREREETHAHLQFLDQNVSRLGASHEELRCDFEQARTETRQELDCLHQYQQHLQGQMATCQQEIGNLHQITADLQQQQNRTVEMLNEVAEYSRQVHRQLEEFERVVEERHRQAMEDLKRQKLHVADARQLAEANLELLDRAAVNRFGMQADYEELENLLHQAHGHSSDRAFQNAALTLYVNASEKAIRLRRRLHDAIREQTLREQRIRHRLDESGRVVETWQADPYVAFYREQALADLRDRKHALEERIKGLESTTSYRDLTEETTAADLEAQALSEEARQSDEKNFPELVNKCQQRDRFIEAIYQGIVDTFERQGMKAELLADRHLADENNRDSNLRFAAGSQTRSVVVEVGLDGDCHFWWEGYPEKTHVKDIEEFESILRQGRELSFELNSRRTFRGEPGYDPPPDFKVLRPPKKVVDVRAPAVGEPEKEMPREEEISQ